MCHFNSIMQSISSDPLFSTFVTLYILIFLYSPCISFKIVFSPVLILTGFLLFSLIRFGEIHDNGGSDSDEKKEEFYSRNENHKWVFSDSEIESISEVGSGLNPGFEESFVEWNVRAPLEVIYEAFEGEEGPGPGPGPAPVTNPKKEAIQLLGTDKYEMLSLYYPETDSETSSEDDFSVIGEWYSPERMCFRWDEEDKEGLIEINLDGKNKRDELDFHVEEDNLIEIDISPARIDEFAGANW